MRKSNMNGFSGDSGEKTTVTFSLDQLAAAVDPHMRQKGINTVYAVSGSWYGLAGTLQAEYQYDELWPDSRYQPRQFHDTVKAIAAQIESTADGQNVEIPQVLLHSFALDLPVLTDCEARMRRRGNNFAPLAERLNRTGRSFRDHLGPFLPPVHLSMGQDAFDETPQTMPGGPQYR